MWPNDIANRDRGSGPVGGGHVWRNTSTEPPQVDSPHPHPKLSKPGDSGRNRMEVVESSKKPPLKAVITALEIGLTVLTYLAPEIVFGPWRLRPWSLNG